MSLIINELNYKIEKDILKETFYSRIESINIVVAIALGVFTIIGFFSLRNVWALQKDYRKEFDGLIRLKEKMKSDYNEIILEHEKTKQELINVNEEQDRRL